jgi:bifunctional enzyme CysN/CysC
MSGESMQQPYLFITSHKVTAAARAERAAHGSGVLWLTGLPGAGKSTLAMELERALFDRGFQVYVLDGDNIRQGLSSDLGFSRADRIENIRRISEVAKLFCDAGFVCITAFISPYIADRERARATIGAHAFHEVYVNADLATCEARDPKGLYGKARRGDLADFTGVSSPYEPPHAPQLVIDTARSDVAECTRQLLEYVVLRFGRRSTQVRASP